MQKKKRYPPKIKTFISENVKGRHFSELAEMVSAEFGIEVTAKQMRAYAKNHKLTNGLFHSPKQRPSKRYPPEIAEFIREHITGTTVADLTAMLNERFGTDYGTNHIRAYIKNHGLRSGLDFRIKPGTQPPNKGKKGYCSPGSERGWFAKGHTPANKQPIGTVLKKADGYLWRKLGERAREWRQEHILVWEETNGPIPEGNIVLFKDGNHENVALDNLTLISRSELAILNRWGLLKTDAELTETAILIARLKHATMQASKKVKKRRKSDDKQREIQ